MAIKLKDQLSWNEFDKESRKEKILFRSHRQPVEAGANGTLNYTIKKGVNKDRIADEKILKNK